ncbi:hypothetical protein H0H93_009277 [Arthromyces matolae]|nr:hypothetical protein H0H93_009277 [Arthromyces matolae]
MTSTSRLNQKLPNELTDIIIDYLRLDISALKACNLVCKAWQPRSRHNLFQSIKLDLTLPPKALETFLSHIKKPDSHFHTTVRTLSLRSEFAPQRQHHLASLCSLRSLTHVTLSDWYTAMPKAHWFSGSQGITHLGLVACRIDCSGFSALMNQLPNIESMLFKSVSWKDRFDLSKAAEGNHILKRLRKLHLGTHSSPVIPALTALISNGIIEGQVEEAVFEDVEIRYERAVGDLLAAIGASLRSLVISAKNKLHDVTHAFALGKNNRLTSVHFADLVDPSHGMSYMCQFSFDWVIQMLLQFPQSVERIIFTFILIPGDKLGIDGSGAKTGEIDWIKLVETLGRLPRLTAVEFRLGAEHAHRQWISRKLLERFPAMLDLMQFANLDDYLELSV